MNKKTILIIIAIVVVIAIAWLFLGKKDQSFSDSTGGVFTGTLFDLMKRGGSYKCTYSMDNEQGKFSGVSYVSGNKVRVDSTGEVGGVSMESHMIADPDFMYTWSPLMPQGVKMATPKDTAESEAGTPVAQDQSYSQQMSYDCAPWTVEESLFTPPANITFQSF